ncbi:10416_t:CDS:1, partial [Gigaspora margarita]
MVKTYLSNVHECEKELTQNQITDSESNESSNESSDELNKENILLFRLKNPTKIATKGRPK